MKVSTRECSIVIQDVRRFAEEELETHRNIDPSQAVRGYRITQEAEEMLGVKESLEVLLDARKFLRGQLKLHRGMRVALRVEAKSMVLAVDRLLGRAGWTNREARPLKPKKPIETIDYLSLLQTSGFQPTSVEPE